MTTKNKLLGALQRAFKAKDATELEKIGDEIATELEGGAAGENGDTHIHIHNGEVKSDAPVMDEEEGEAAGRASFTDQDIQAHIDQNAAEHADMAARIEALEAKLAGQGATDEEGEGEVMDEEMEQAIKDEVPEEIAEKAAKANDSIYLADSFQDTVALAEILVPGIKVPTFDSAAKPGQSVKKICNLRKQALDEAYQNSATRLLIGDLLSGKALNTKNMTCDAARTLFRSAAAMKRSQNMSPRANAGDASAAKSGPVVTLAELNRRNAERYK